MQADDVSKRYFTNLKTRDPERIKRVLAKLEEAWLLNPDSRLGQLVSNLTEVGDSIFYQEDTITEKRLDGLIELSSRR